MRPVFLELTAFGPYQRRQAIDFAALGGSDLFLVHGPTGAGKTTLFDGITYALFGKLAGTRGVDRLRADQAPKELRTRVVFRFTMGAEAWRVERSPEWEREKKRGVGTTTEPAEASLWREGEAKPVASGASDTTAAVVGLLGMGVDQFTQVALLPQGEFKRLLCADSAEREVLLQRLFATHRYEAVEDWLVDRKRRLESRAAELRNQSAGVLGEEPREVHEAALHAALAAEAAAAGEVVRLKVADGAAEAELAAARALSARLAEREKARAEDAAARAGAAGLAADRQRLARAEAAERARAPLQQAARDAEGAAARAREAEAAEAGLARAAAALEVAAAGARAAEAEAPERAALAARAQVLGRALPEVARLATLEREAAEAGAGAAKAGAAAAQAASELAAAEQEPAALEAEAARLRPVAGTVGPRAEALAALEAAWKAAVERDAAQATAAAREREAEAGARAAGAAREAAERAERTAAALNAAREGGLAAWLAQKKLQPGKPCPVCGATDHPAPATAAGHVPDKEHVDQARAEATALGGRAAEAEAARARLAGLLEEARRRAAALAAAEGRPTATLAAQRAAAAAAAREAGEAAARLAALEDRLGEARAAVETARSRRDAAAGREATARAEAGAAEAKRAELGRQLAQAGAGPGAAEELSAVQADLAGRQRRADAAAEAHRQAATAKAQAATALAGAQAARDRAAAEAAASSGAARAACAAEGFEDVAACQAALLVPAARTELAAAIERRASAAHAAAARLTELTEALAGAAPPDLPAREAARAAAAAALGAATEARVRHEAEAARRRDLLARSAELGREVAALEETLSVVGDVAELVRGRNEKGMSLQRFVLAALLEEVAEAASERLHLMSRGRFRLRQDDAVARRGSAAGLSLVVEDAWTGVTDRPVGALSGGESFLASLALALGLSDVVSARSGGRQLDALFVDEGFGTLDEATLDVALQALEGLRRAGRMVGVISHVVELRRRIPARIEVAHGEGGSVATVKVG